MTTTDSSKIPRYRQIMQVLLREIEVGGLTVGDAVPSEHQLVERFGVARMTVNRALKELEAQGYINRIQGVGSFVADLRPQSSLLDVQDIAADIRRRGHRYSCDVRMLCEAQADQQVAAALELERESKVYHSLIVHKEENQPVQLEARYVLPDFARDYLLQDFTTTTPYHYLMAQGGINEIEHSLGAELLGEEHAQLLEAKTGSAALVLLRRTWSNKRVVTFGQFHYPGDRYRLFSHYSLNKLA